MADETTPPTDAEPAADDHTVATEALPVVDVTPVPVAARRRLDTRSVIATTVAIAALAASFGVGYAVGDHDGDVPRDVRRAMQFRGGAPGMLPGGPGMRRDGGGFDRRFDSHGPADADGGQRADERGFRPKGRLGAAVMGTVTKLAGNSLTIDPMGDENARTLTLSDDVRVIKRGADGREDGSRSDLDTGALVATRDATSSDKDDAIDTIVVLQTP
jgi:hypothetical protein